MFLLNTIHIHLDYDIGVDDHKVHCIVMKNNGYATKKPK